MGGNGSYDEDYGGVPEDRRTHTEVEGPRIGGHKILVPTNNPTRGSAPMNCNSPNQVYLIGSVADSRSGENAGEIKITSVAFYEGHHIQYSIDVKYDEAGKIISFRLNSGEETTHAHNWQEISPGIWGRVSRAKDNHLNPDSRWNNQLVEAIQSFNSKRVKWNQ